jgi:Family of unknown function (DUF6151)
MNTDETLTFECKCGKIAGVANTKHTKGYRAICLCDDCQAFAHFLGRDDVLDANGGTDIFPITPANVKFTRGVEHLQCLRLTGKGMHRWFSSCCKTPIANTPASAGLPYVGLIHTILEKANSNEVLDKSFGPVYARIHGRFGVGPLSPGTLNSVSPGFILRVLKFAILGKIRGQQQPSPFFKSDGKPTVTPYVLTAQERESLRHPH